MPRFFHLRHPPPPYRSSLAASPLQAHYTRLRTTYQEKLKKLKKDLQPYLTTQNAAIMLAATIVLLVVWAIVRHYRKLTPLTLLDRITQAKLVSQDRITPASMAVISRWLSADYPPASSDAHARPLSTSQKQWHSFRNSKTELTFDMRLIPQQQKSFDPEMLQQTLSIHKKLLALDKLAKIFPKVTTITYINLDWDIYRQKYIYTILKSSRIDKFRNSLGKLDELSSLKKVVIKVGGDRINFSGMQENIFTSRGWDIKIENYTPTAKGFFQKHKAKKNHQITLTKRSPDQKAKKPQPPPLPSKVKKKHQIPLPPAQQPTSRQHTPLASSPKKDIYPYSDQDLSIQKGRPPIAVQTKPSQTPTFHIDTDVDQDNTADDQKEERNNQ